MTTEQETKIESDLQTLLTRITAEHEAAKGLTVEIKKLEDDVDTLDAHLNASQKDIAVFLDTQSKELDTLLAEEQKDMDADKVAVDSDEE
jgi:septal ring factor EnvC (AmiA/AmiB activator)